jgi:hypothetical protein
MNEKNRDISFILFIVTILILSVVYFSVPERVQFMEFQIIWWKEFLSVLTSFLS